MESLEYDPLTGQLTCTSTGGPATEVVWQRNGVAETSFQESQLVTNTMSATYSNTLLLNRAPEAVVGSYGCSVRNSRGSSDVALLELWGNYVKHILETCTPCMKKQESLK